MSTESTETAASNRQRRRGLIILGISAAAFLAIVGAALIPHLTKDDPPPKSGGTVGATITEADCSPVQQSSATGGGDHRKDGTRIVYPDGPPASGPHWGNFLYGPQIRNFYTREDRPPIEQLVHSLEHGHTLVWYDETIVPGTPAYADLKQYASALQPDAYLMVAPWNAADGPAFPTGKHLAMTHWTGPKDQEAVRQYCGSPSGAAIDAFRKKFTPQNAPEPGAP